jgi:hypothetical protein
MRKRKSSMNIPLSKANCIAALVLIGLIILSQGNE